MLLQGDEFKGGTEGRLGDRVLKAHQGQAQRTAPPKSTRQPAQPWGLVSATVCQDGGSGEQGTLPLWPWGRGSGPFQLSCLGHLSGERMCGWGCSWHSLNLCFPPSSQPQHPCSYPLLVPALCLGGWHERTVDREFWAILLSAELGACWHGHPGTETGLSLVAFSL